MLDSVTRKRIDNCRDILVGKLPSPSAQVEQITIALIYKFMDDMDRVTVEEYGGNPTFFEGEFEKYSWQNIYSPRTDAHQMLNLYAEGIQKMGQNPGLNPMFRSIFKDAFLPYRDPETLRLFLSTINEFSYEHSEMLGDAFEYLLSIMGSQGDAGQFRTPRHIIDFLVELVDPKIGETILDPACGTSGFLISAYKHILNNNKKDKPGDLLSSTQKKELLESINGYDISPDMVRLSSANLFLHGFTDDELNIHEYDTLSSEDRWNEYYDVIIANPPFMTPKGGIRPHNRFSVDSNRAEVLFTNYIMEHLTPKGRAGIVVPEGIIFQSGKAYKQLRKALVEKYLIGVISLPSGVFNPYSGVKTSILILDKELSQKTDKIFFGKVENDGYDLGAQRRKIDKNDLPQIKDSVLEYFNNLEKGIDIEHQNLSYVSKEEIISSEDYVLSLERYLSVFDYKGDIPLEEISSHIELTSGFAFKSKSFNKDGKGMPLIRIRDIKTNEISTYYQGEYDDKYLVRKGDLLVGMDGEFNCCIWNNREALLNQRVCKIECKSSLDKKYLYYIIQKELKRIEENTFAVTVKHISSKQIKSIEIPLPSLEIQKEIVEELEQYQKEIEKSKLKIEQLNNSIEDRINKIWGD